MTMVLLPKCALVRSRIAHKIASPTFKLHATKQYFFFYLAWLMKHTRAVTNAFVLDINFNILHVTIVLFLCADRHFCFLPYARSDMMNYHKSEKS